MSVNGTLSEHQKTFLKILMAHYDSLKEHLTEVETSLEEGMAPFALQVEQLNSIYGISTTAFCAIIAEIGIDMNPYDTMPPEISQVKRPSAAKLFNPAADSLFQINLNFMPTQHLSIFHVYKHPDLQLASTSFRRIQPCSLLHTLLPC